MSNETELSSVMFRIYFDFNDWWIGYYRGPNHHYICLVPTLVLRWNRHCREAGEAMVEHALSHDGFRRSNAQKRLI